MCRNVRLWIGPITALSCLLWLGPVAVEAQVSLLPQRPLAGLPQATVLAQGFTLPRQLVTAPGGGWVVREASGKLWRVSAAGKRSPDGLALSKDAKLLTATVAWTNKQILRRTLASAWKPWITSASPITAALVHNGAVWWTSQDGGGSLRKRALSAVAASSAEPIEPLNSTTGLVNALYPAAAGVLLAVGGVEPRGLKRFSPKSPENGVQSELPWLAKSRFYTRALVRSPSAKTPATWVLNTTTGGWLERLQGDAFVRLTFVPSGSSHLVWLGDALYWRGAGAIFRYRLPKNAATGTPAKAPLSTLAAGEAIAMNTAPVGLLVDGDSLIWLDSHRGQLLRLANPADIPTNGAKP